MRLLLSILVVFFIFRAVDGWRYTVKDDLPGRFVILVRITDTSFLWIEASKDGLKLQELVKS